MGKFNNRLFGSQVEPDIINKFKELEKGSESNDVLGSVETVNYQKYLGERMTFARMWSPLLLIGFDGETGEEVEREILYHTLNDNRTSDYQEPLDSISDNFINELQDNTLLKPKAGITSISTKTEGSLGAIKRTQVDFVVHNKKDFDEIYQPYFLKPGATLVVDFGWSDSTNSLYDVDSVIGLSDVYLDNFKNFIYGRGSNFTDFISTSQRDGYLYKEENFGTIDVNIGRVVDFNAKYTNQEQYDCSVTIVSENASLLDKEITEDNDLKFLFTNKFEEVLIEVLTSPSSNGVGSAQFLASDSLTVKGKQQAIEEFFRELKLVSRPTEKGVALVNKKNIQNGIFYQDLLAVFGDNSSKLETGYISYGLFEDLFLNSLIAENSKTDIHNVRFNTKETLVRYSPLLVRKQQALPNNSEGLSQFVYPTDTDWLSEGYHCRTAYTEVPEDFDGTLKDYRKSLYEKMLLGKHENYNTEVIPLRDLFISIKVITKAFESKQSVNDALLDILDEISRDSHNILNLKITQQDSSYSEVTVVDLNLHPPYDDTLIFDVTEDSIVSNFDLNFMMPKGGIANMIAIGENTDEENLFSADRNLDALRYLELLGPDKDNFGVESFAVPLPLMKDLEQDKEEDEVERVDFVYDKTSKVVANLPIFEDAADRDFKSIFVKAMNRAEKRSETTQKPNDQKLGKISRRLGKLLAKDKRQKATSQKDYYGKLANQEVFGNKNTSPGALIRGELSITTFGNTYLNIGDYVTVNYLPKHISDKLIYLITNVEHKLGDNWETTYTTSAILKPEFKQVFTGEILNCVYDPSVLGSWLKESNEKNSALERASQGPDLGATDVDTGNAFITCKKIKSRFTKDVFDEVEETGKSDSTIKKLGESFIVNEFQSVVTLQEFKFVMALQETVLKYLYGIAPNKRAATDKKTQLKLFSKTPEYDENLYNPKDGGGLALETEFGDGTDFPSIFLVGLIEDADDEYDALNDNLNAAGTYVHALQVGDTTRNVDSFPDDFNESKNRDRALMVHIAKKKYNKQFFDTFVNQSPINTNYGRVVEGLNNKGTVHVRVNTDLNELETEHGMILSAFGFQLNPSRVPQGDDAEPIVTYLFHFNLPFQDTHINNSLFLPDYFFTKTGLSPKKFAEEIQSLYSNNDIDKAFYKMYEKQYTEAAADYGEMAKDRTVGLIKGAWNWAFGDDD